MRVMTKPVVETFECDYGYDEENPEPKIKITIRQARNADNQRREKLTEKAAFANSPDGTGRQLNFSFNPSEHARLDAFMTLAGAENLEDENGVPLFRFKEGKNGPELAMTEPEFYAVWDYRIPPALSEEIHDYIFEVNPHWNGAGN